MRIILAVLSFKRLQEEHKRDYKGGILLIDELDATLYGFSQRKLIDYLWNAAKESKIQIVFTTHSSVVLKSVNKYQRREYQEKGINLPPYAYDSSIVYLEPKYIDGKRTIMPRNIFSNSELNTVTNDINLMVLGGNKISVYCEDMRASVFLQYILANALGINLELYMNFVDINLGWTNYVQLYEKNVPEFKDNIIVLDGDVPSKPEFRSKARVINEAGNFLFLPLVIEKGLFILLKDYDKFAEFQENYSCVSALNYDICFNEWPLGSNQYATSDYKAWFKQIESILGDQTILFRFWCDNNQQQVDEFVANFIQRFNVLAERKDVDALPPIEIVQEDNLNEEEI